MLYELSAPAIDREQRSQMICLDSMRGIRCLPKQALEPTNYPPARAAAFFMHIVTFCILPYKQYRRTDSPSLQHDNSASGVVTVVKSPGRRR